MLGTAGDASLRPGAVLILGSRPRSVAACSLLPPAGGGRDCSASAPLDPGPGSAAPSSAVPSGPRAALRGAGSSWIPRSEMWVTQELPWCWEWW